MRPKQQKPDLQEDLFRYVVLRQSYVRVAKRAAIMAGRYAHAKQFKRHNKQIKFLRTAPGAVDPRYSEQD